MFCAPYRRAGAPILVANPVGVHGVANSVGVNVLGDSDDDARQTVNQLWKLPGPVTPVARGGAHIAYQVIGDGVGDLVYVPNWASPIDLMWEHPAFARFLWTTSIKRGWGALRLTTIGRKSGQERSVIIGRPWVRSVIGCGSAGPRSIHGSTGMPASARPRRPKSSSNRATGPLDTRRGRSSRAAGRRPAFVEQALRGRLHEDCPSASGRGVPGTWRRVGSTRGR